MPLRRIFGVLVCFLAVSRFHIATGFPDETLPPFQDDRIFYNVCENCTVSRGFGFAKNPYFCDCYYTCVLVASSKLASYANPWVSYLRCCPCHMTFSSKLLTCVDYTDKRSDCFDRSLDNNQCYDEEAGSLLYRQNPDSALPLAPYLCSGFVTCRDVGGYVVPDPCCCPNGQCFSQTSLECSPEACNELPCALLREKDDCECDQTDAPDRECAFVRMSSSIFQFMGRENMKVYDCAPGTCWDQRLCTCVRTNNTGYNDCSAFAKMKFDNNELTARDNLGNTIWTEVYGNVTITNDEASFTYGYISVSGLANTYLDNKFVFHFYFEPSDIEAASSTTECVVGSCVNYDGFVGDERFYITLTEIENDDDDLTVTFSYKDRDYWIPGTDTTERFTLELLGEFEDGVGYEFWMFYGWEEEVIIGTIGTDNVVFTASAPVNGTKVLLPPESGFVFGRCQYGEDFFGEMDCVEMYRGCKPYGEPDFDAAFALIHSPETVPDDA